VHEHDPDGTCLKDAIAVISHADSKVYVIAITIQVIEAVERPSKGITNVQTPCEPASFVPENTEFLHGPIVFHEEHPNAASAI